MTVCPVLFRKQFLLWGDRKQNNKGFRGAYDTAVEADSERAATEKPDTWQIIETGQHLVLLVHEDGTTEEIMISMGRTKLKVSRNWNTLVRLNGNDRFSRQYIVHSIEDEAPAGAFYNLSVANSGFPTQEIYQRAEHLYQSINTGERSVVVDTKEEADATKAPADVEY